MEIKDRLRMVMQSHGLSAGEFADRIGVQRSNVSHVLNGRNKPGFEFLEKVVRNFPRVQAHWILTGEQKEEVKPTQEGTNLFTNAEKTETAPTKKEVTRIVTFYSDQSFEIAYPSSE